MSLHQVGQSVIQVLHVETHHRHSALFEILYEISQICTFEHLKIENPEEHGFLVLEETLVDDPNVRLDLVELLFLEVPV